FANAGLFLRKNVLSPPRSKCAPELRESRKMWGAVQPGATTFGNRGGSKLSSLPHVLFIMSAEPVHPVVVLRIAHDGVNVIGLLDGEFDNQRWPMNSIVKGAANVVGRATPGKVQLS